jgi:O-methyltransferase
VRYPPRQTPHPDFDEQINATISAVISKYTGTSAERIAALVESVRYVVSSGIQGSIVECGVWRGGSMMAAARTLLETGDRTRDLWLYDTFEGMTDPTDADLSWDGRSPNDLLSEDMGSDAAMSDWCYASLGEVQRNMRGTGFPEEQIHYVVGRVEDTIPQSVPERIAVLRLDTDWYESTNHELLHLFPHVTPGGVVIVDDYGHWRGSRKAVDEYLEEQGVRAFLCRIDETARAFVKQI